MSNIVFVSLMALWAIICVVVLVMIYVKGKKEHCHLEDIDLEKPQKPRSKENKKSKNDEDIKIIEI